MLLRTVFFLSILLHQNYSYDLWIKNSEIAVKTNSWNYVLTLRGSEFKLFKYNVTYFFLYWEKII